MFNAKNALASAMSVGGSNNAGGLGKEALAAGSQWGFGGGSPTLRLLYSFFPKNMHF